MEISLSKNIKALRKERGLTQEQLADMLGVTTGAVHKWESGISVPEIGMIVMMADFFDTSVDFLLGYRLNDNKLSEVSERIQEYLRTMNPLAIEEADSALRKYPNSFDIVYKCAVIYHVFGLGEHDKAKLRRSLELLERSLLLIEQNTDPEMGELVVYGEMAEIRMVLGEAEEGIKILKDHNIGGLFSDVIGVGLPFFLGRYEEAENYLTTSFMRSLSSLVNTITGFVLVFCSRKDYANAQDIVSWGLELIRGLRKHDTTDFIGKVETILLVLYAHTLMMEGNTSEAEESLQKAYRISRMFDEAPDYSLVSIRYVQNPERIFIHDSLGSKASESIEKLLDILHHDALTALWKKVSSNE